MKRLLLLTCIVLSGVLASSASAAIVIDFGTALIGNGGLVTVSGSNAIGSNIPLGAMTVTIGNSTSVYDTSGTATSTNQDPNLSAALNFNTSANTIQVIGGIPTLGIANGTVLLSGTFSSFAVSNFGFAATVFGTGIDTKNPALLTALGIPTNTPFTFFGFTISNVLTSGGGFVATSTDINNTGVPEPTSIVLLGTVLIGVCRLLRQRVAPVA